MSISQLPRLSHRGLLLKKEQLELETPCYKQFTGMHETSNLGANAVYGCMHLPIADNCMTNTLSNLKNRPIND